MRSTRVDNGTMNALDKSIQVVGGQSALAKAIGGTPQLVNNWVRRGGRVPMAHCPSIERATDGAVTCEDLRPDVDWSVLRQQRQAA